MSDQVTAPASEDAGDEIVWAKSPGGRLKQMSRAKLDILRGSGWAEGGEPGQGDVVVPPLSSATTEEHPELRSAPAAPAAPPAAPPSGRSGRGATSEES